VISGVVRMVLDIISSCIGIAIVFSLVFSVPLLFLLYFTTLHVVNKDFQLAPDPGASCTGSHYNMLAWHGMAAVDGVLYATGPRACS